MTRIAIKADMRYRKDYEYLVYLVIRPGMFHRDGPGVYATSRAPTGASCTYFVGETLGL